MSESLYHVWKGMVYRCHGGNDAMPYYDGYEGRGIIVTPAWHDYDRFHRWAILNGYLSGLTLERVNVDGNYEPSNCTWATRTAQQRNRRDSVYLTFKGKRQHLEDWAIERGIKPATLRSRLRAGYSIQSALNPVTKRGTR
jgi:hypothetical protein